MANSELKPTPQQPVLGAIARFLRGVQSAGTAESWVPLIGGRNIGEFFLGRAPEEVENWSYGNAPLRMNPNTGVPGLKPGRGEPLADALFFAADAAPAVRGASRLATRGMNAVADAAVRGITGNPAATAPAVLQAAAEMSPLSSVVKNKGGNWLAGSIEDVVKPLKRPEGPVAIPMDDAGMAAYRAQGYTRYDPETGALSRPDPLNKWLDQKLTKYMRNEMATPEDPVRLQVDRFVAERQELLAAKDAQIAKAREDMEAARASRGFTPEMMTASQARIRELQKQRDLIASRQGLHFEPQNTFLHSDIADMREQLGYPRHGMGKSRAASDWETLADEFVKYSSLKAHQVWELAPDSMIEANPWLAKLDPETRVYGLLGISSPNERLGFANERLGFDHIVDELRNALNPNSGLPKGLLLDPNKLDKMTVPQAVQLVDKINAWRSVQKAEADLARASNAATVEHKAYDVVPGTDRPNERGLRWVELKQTENLPEGWSQVGGNVVGPENAVAIKGSVNDPRRLALEDALKYEGDVMGHCVGGYCSDVAKGKSRIFSLRDAEGRPHVTVEVEPGRLSGKNSLDDWKARFAETHGPEAVEPFLAEHPEIAQAFVPAIKQIKGKQNRAPADEYLPFVQDFVRSGQWSSVGDLANTGLTRVGGKYLSAEEVQPLVERASQFLKQSPALERYRQADRAYSEFRGRVQSEEYDAVQRAAAEIVHPDVPYTYRELRAILSDPKAYIGRDNETALGENLERIETLRGLLNDTNNYAQGGLVDLAQRYAEGGLVERLKGFARAARPEFLNPAITEPVGEAAREVAGNLKLAVTDPRAALTNIARNMQSSFEANPTEWAMNWTGGGLGSMPLAGVIKPKGGNWLAGSVENAAGPLRQKPEWLGGEIINEAAGENLWAKMVQTEGHYAPHEWLLKNRPDVYDKMIGPEGAAVNKWLDTKLTKYIKNEMGTPEDPVRALAERGVLHFEPRGIRDQSPTMDKLRVTRQVEGFPAEGTATTPLGQQWERYSDYAIEPRKAGNIQSQAQRGAFTVDRESAQRAVEKNPWISKLDPESKIYGARWSSFDEERLGFQHLVDELKNALDPATTLPRELRLTPAQLEKVTVPQAVERVAKINAWRAQEAAKAEKTGMLENLQAAPRLADDELQLSFVGQPGGKWVDIPETVTDEGAKLCTSIGKAGGWCTQDDWAAKSYGSGENRLTALVDTEGRPHAQAKITSETYRGDLDSFEEAIKKLTPEQEAELRAFQMQLDSPLEMDDALAWLRENAPQAFEEFKRASAQQVRVPDITELKPPSNSFDSDRAREYIRRDPQYRAKVTDSVLKFLNSGEWGKVADLHHYDIVDLQEPNSLLDGLKTLYGDESSRRVGQEFIDAFNYVVDTTPEAPRFMTTRQLREFIGPVEGLEGYAEGGLVGLQAKYAGGGAVTTTEYDPAAIDALVNQIMESENV